MSRAQRLLDLIQMLRSHRFPVAGAQLAAALGISLRTLYRDIATLQQQGASIEGEAGLGYLLRPGFMLPPLMFSAEEIEALALASGVMVGLWARHTVEPPAPAHAYGGELAFSVASNAEVDALYADWGRRSLVMAQSPSHMDFGYTFVALDPDGHRLRVFAPSGT